MIEREADILPLLCGVAVFTQPLRSLPDALLQRRRDFPARGQRWAILGCRRLCQIADHPIEKAEVVIYLFVAIQFPSFLYA